MGVGDCMHSETLETGGLSFPFLQQKKIKVFIETFKKNTKSFIYANQHSIDTHLYINDQQKSRTKNEFNKKQSKLNTAKKFPLLQLPYITKLNRNPCS